jgi:hypothetical protein
MIIATVILAVGVDASFSGRAEKYGLLKKWPAGQNRGKFSNKNCGKMDGY